MVVTCSCSLRIMETEKPFKEGHLLFPPHGVLGQLKVSFIYCWKEQLFLLFSVLQCKETVEEFQYLCVYSSWLECTVEMYWPWLSTQTVKAASLFHSTTYCLTRCYWNANRMIIWKFMHSLNCSMWGSSSGISAGSCTEQVNVAVTF
jgi:hypothetical protein